MKLYVFVLAYVVLVVYVIQELVKELRSPGADTHAVLVDHTPALILLLVATSWLVVAYRLSHQSPPSQNRLWTLPLSNINLQLSQNVENN